MGDEVATIRASLADIDKTPAGLSKSNSAALKGNEKDQRELDKLKAELQKSARSKGIEISYRRTSTKKVALRYSKPETSPGFPSFRTTPHSAAKFMILELRGDPPTH